MEIMVKWARENGTLLGRAPAQRKIVFPSKGKEALCCLQDHEQPCLLIKDTKPQDSTKGALIVEPRAPCPTCIAVKKALAQLGEGWKHKEGRYVAPDGVASILVAPADMATAKASYERRERRKAITAFLEGNRDTFKDVPYPEGEPTIPASPGPWDEPPKFVRVKRIEGVEISVGPSGIGVVVTTPTFNVESDDSMGTRSMGGEATWAPLELIDMWGRPGPWRDDVHSALKAKSLHDAYGKVEAQRISALAEADETIQQALTQLRERHASRDARYADWLGRRLAYDEACSSWLDWWRALTDTQKVRVFLRTGGIIKTRKGWSVNGDGRVIRAAFYPKELEGGMWRLERYEGDWPPHEVDLVGVLMA